MIKKLLKQISNIISLDQEKIRIEKYLANSEDLADLECRMKEIEKSGTYSKYYM